MRVSFYKFVTLALIGLLALVPALTVSAQDCPPGIGASDCALIAAATGENAAKLTSFVMDFTVDAEASGLQEGNFSLTVKGSGGIDLSKVDPSVTDINEVLPSLIFSVIMDASLTSGTENQSGTVEVRVVDGRVFLRGFDGTDAWQEVPLEMLSGQLGAFGGSSDDLGGLLGNLNNPALADLFGAIQTVYSASDGPTIDGVRTRAITATTDLKPFLQALADPNISEALSQIIPQDDPNTAQLGSFLPLLGAIFEELNVVATQYYGTDGTFRGLKLELNLGVDGQMAAMLTGAPNDISVQFTLDVRLSKLGEPYTVEVPIQ